jgi:hypothetical protein
MALLGLLWFLFLGSPSLRTRIGSVQPTNPFNTIYYPKTLWKHPLYKTARTSLVDYIEKREELNKEPPHHYMNAFQVHHESAVLAVLGRRTECRKTGWQRIPMGGQRGHLNY